MNRRIENIKLPLAQLGVRSNQFVHDSALHGASHVNRVIVHALQLCEVMGYEDITPECWAAAYLHDLARRHDGVCYEHGRWAVGEKLPLYEGFFGEAGVKNFDALTEAVTFHSMKRENRENRVCNILKDADALDRCRRGDLDPSYLRLEPTLSMIADAERLFYQTESETDWMVIWRASDKRSAHQVMKNSM